ncbi:MAG: hypothetical protein ACFFG0_37885 [Candidatus Thorarchaeota archaeon]
MTLYLKLEKSLGLQLGFNTIYNPLPRGIVIENGVIKWLSLEDCRFKKVPEIIKELKKLDVLVLRRNSLVTLPDWIGDFDQLQYNDVSSNQLEKISESFGNLRKLKQ